MGKIKTQILEVKELKKGIKLTVIVPTNSFKLKDVAFGYKTISLYLDDTNKPPE